MTSSTATAAVNTAIAATASSAPAAGQASNRDPRADFRKPLQQARQQQQQAQATPSQPPAARDGDPKSAKRATKPASAADDAHDHGKDDATTTGTAASPPDAASAMLALLGQSIPAQATPVPVATSDQGTDATVAMPAAMPALNGLPASLGLPAQGSMPPGAQAGADDLLDAKGASELKDDALASATQDTGDDAGSAFTGALAAASKTLPSSSNSPASSGTDHSDPLQAINALAATPPPQAQPAAAAPAAHALTMQSSAGTPAFAQELGQQVAWLGGQDIKQARIRLHPEDLGQLDVKVSVKQDHVDVAFIAQHPQAVHAVQQTLGQLDMMLAHHGLSLGHAEVGQGGRGSESGQGGSSAGSGASAEDASQETGGLAAVAAPVIKAIGLLDTFA